MIYVLAFRFAGCFSDPMTQSGRLILALDRLVDFHLSSVTDGLVVLGTTGEAATIGRANETDHTSCCFWVAAAFRSLLVPAVMIKAGC